MMRIQKLACLLTIVAGTATAYADKEKHEEKFCAALTALGSDMSGLQALGPTSTMKEVRAALKQADKDGQTVATQAKKIGTPTAKQFTQSLNQLSDKSSKLSDNMTVEQAHERINQDIKNVVRDAKALATESGCPEGIPQRDMSQDEKSQQKQPQDQPPPPPPEGQQKQNQPPQDQQPQQEQPKPDSNQ